ncbi:hypothetical protein HPB48_019064 [Haemaphysalis longicornis]|uniref:Uncharacterized protein n=1 Tax=Haemaphysalis longicornis TaxID=44386 RepID=A0A9J6GWM0_HAELO|nr:hypothetical protein HPB48_019064 [Haemaphysalis longicornis]
MSGVQAPILAFAGLKQETLDTESPLLSHSFGARFRISTLRLRICHPWLGERRAEHAWGVRRLRGMVLSQVVAEVKATYNNKEATLEQHIQHAAKRPYIIILQETVTLDPTLPGYNTYADMTGRRGVCTFVRKGLTAVEHQLHKGRKGKCEHTCLEKIPGKRCTHGLYVVNVYSNP